MKIDDIRYQHRHDSNFRIDRPGGTGKWLLLLVKTPVVFNIEQVEVSVTANSFALFEPDCPVFYRAGGPVYTEDQLQFYPDADELKLIHSLRLPLNRVTEIADVTELSDLFRAVCYEYYSVNPHKLKTISLYFRLLLYKLNECSIFGTSSNKFTSGSDFDQLLQIREQIYREPARDWSVDQLASDLSMSRSWLQHLYSGIFGVNVLQDIISSRLECACTLLVESNLSAVQISDRCGYSTPSYFLRQFKTRFGMTPKNYRRMHQRTEPLGPRLSDDSDDENDSN